MTWTRALACAVLLSGCFKTVRPDGPLPDPPAAGAFPHEILDALLKEHVTPEGKVDYKGIQADRAELNRYLGYVAVVSPHSDPALFPTPQHALAYWINAYNALAVTGVIDRPGLVSVIDNQLDFFVETRYVLGGEKTNLYTLENGIVRKDFQDPRIHFALNCQSGGCPTLPDTVFPPGDLDAFLDAEAKEFCNNPGKVRVEGDKLFLSEIFKWYDKDFEAAGGAAEFVKRYRGDVPANATIEFIPYDWTLIAQPDRGP